MEWRSEGPPCSDRRRPHLARACGSPVRRRQPLRRRQRVPVPSRGREPALAGARASPSPAPAGPAGRAARWSPPAAGPPTSEGRRWGRGSPASALGSSGRDPTSRCPSTTHRSRSRPARRRLLPAGRRRGRPMRPAPSGSADGDAALSRGHACGGIAPRGTTTRRVDVEVRRPFPRNSASPRRADIPQPSAASKPGLRGVQTTFQEMPRVVLDQ